MCAENKVTTIVVLLQQHADLLSKLLKRELTQAQYESVVSCFWDSLKALGYNAEELAIGYDQILREWLSETYTWADVLVFLNVRKNSLLDDYGLRAVDHPLRVELLDVIRKTYAAA